MTLFFLPAGRLDWWMGWVFIPFLEYYRQRPAALPPLPDVICVSHGHLDHVADVPALIHGDSPANVIGNPRLCRALDDLSWKKWAKRFDRYLNRLEALIWPDLIILGGGASKKQHKFFHRLTVNAEVVPAATLNEAGIIGAALAVRGAEGY